MAHSSSVCEVQKEIFNIHLGSPGAVHFVRPDLHCEIGT